MSTYGNRPAYQTETVGTYEEVRSYYEQFDEFDAQDFDEWYYDTYLPWAISHTGVADDQTEHHEDAGHCSDESMYMPHAQKLVLDYSNEVNPSTKFWKRGRKQWKRYVNTNFADPVSFWNWFMAMYGGVRLNMDLYARRRVARNYDNLNNGRAVEQSTPMITRVIKSVMHSLSGSGPRRNVRRRLF